MSKARQTAAGLCVQWGAQWLRGQEPQPPEFAPSAEAGAQTKVLPLALKIEAEPAGQLDAEGAFS